MNWELSPEHVAFRATCRAFTDREIRPLVDEAEANGQFPADLLKRFGAAGLLGLCTPEEFGGAEGDSLAVALLSEELARASGGIAVTALVSAYIARIDAYDKKGPALNAIVVVNPNALTDPV